VSGAITVVTAVRSVKVSPEQLDAEAGRLLARIEGFCGRDQDFAIQIESSLRAALVLIAGTPALRYLLNPRGEEKFAETRDRWFDAYATLLHGAAERSPETNTLDLPPIAPRFVIAGSSCLIYRRLFAGEAGGVERLLSDLMEFVLTYYPVAGSGAKSTT
jgi:hypothetical protein